MELLDVLMQWVVAPVAAFVGLIYLRQQDHHTDIAVLKSRIDSNKEAQERETQEIREMTNKIFAKLDSIEQALRK